jgi:phospholipid/cholesterol/gamma-HCH transport system substrate-binding protein
MKEAKLNALVAITALLAALLMIVGLSYAIGKWSLNTSVHTFTVVFPSASGLSANSQVKLAGAPIGRVVSVKLIPLEQQTQDPLTQLYNSVGVEIAVAPTAQVQDGCSVTIRQDGIGIVPQYLLITPGRDHQAKLLENGAVLQGEPPLDMSGLVQTAGNTLLKVDALVDQMQPAMTQLKTLSATMNDQLPPFLGKSEKLVDNLNGMISSMSDPDDPDKLKKLITNLDLVAVKGTNTLGKVDITLDRLDPALDQLKSLSATMNEQFPSLLTRASRLVDNTNGLVAAVGSPEQQAKLKQLIANLKVVSDNLKVVTANAEALTATLAQTPWRLVWGGKTVQPPPTDQVLKSNESIPVQNKSGTAP